MPWTVEDVDKHKKGLSPAEKKKWVTIANSIYKQCLDKGGKDSECAPKAIRIANSKFMEEGMTVKKEPLKVARKALCFTDLNGGVVSFKAEEEGKEAILNMTAYSGKIIPKHWYWGDLVIDVSGMKISDKNIPILQDHETDRKVGFGTFKKENNQILSDKTAFVDTADANEFIRLSKKGFPYQASIQGRPIRIQKLSEDETAEVNGFTMKGPGTIWRESVLVECSVCTFGADSNTKSVAMSENQDMEVEIEQTLKEKEVQNMDLKQFQTEHPDLYAQVFSLGKTEGITEGKTSAETSFKADKTLLESWVKALHSENVKLTEHSSDVERRIVALEKTQALTVEQGIKSTADSAFSEIMVKHDIPERLRPKIRKQLNHQSFIADDKLDVCKFQEAIETELKDWVSDAEETSVMGFSITNNSNKTGSEDTMVTRMLNYVGVTTKQ